MSRVLGQPTANVCHPAGIVKRVSCSSYNARAAYQREALNAGRHCTVSRRVDTLCRASSTRADEPQLVRQRSQPWNYKLGAVYQNLLPGPLLFLPSLLQPVSTIISLEGAAHGHEWVHWLLSLLPVPQVTFTWLRQDFTRHGHGAWLTHDCCIQVVMQFPVLGLVDVLYQQHIDLANGVLDAAISLVGIYFSFVLMPAMDAVLGTDLHPKSMVSLLHRLVQYLVYCDAWSIAKAWDTCLQVERKVASEDLRYRALLWTWVGLHSGLLVLCADAVHGHNMHPLACLGQLSCTLLELPVFT